MIVSIVGCASTPEGVKLASKSEILRYAEMNFGNAEYITQEEKDTSIIYTLQDKQYGFEYTVKTFAQEQGMDGSVFGYTENKSNNFINCYLAYIAEQLDQIVEDGLQFEQVKYPTQEYFAKIVVSCGLTKNIISQIEIICKQIEDIDTRGYFSNSKLYVENEDGETLGAYNFGNNEFKTQYNDQVLYYMETAKSIIKYDVYYHQKATKDKLDVDGLSECTLASILGTDNDTKEQINCYYFGANDKEYFIADVLVDNLNAKYSQYYIYCITDKNAVFAEE